MRSIAPTSSHELDRAFAGMADKVGDFAHEQVAPAIVRAAKENAP